MNRNQLLTLLEEIKSSPESFLGSRSITRLASWIDGFYYGAAMAGALSDPLFSEFQNWIIKHYRMSSMHRWEEVILFFERDEGYALRRFFVLFDQYRAELEEKKNGSTE